MGVFEELGRRGFIYQVTDPGLAKVLNEGRLAFYAGFDPTADSLHIGSLLVIMGMVHLQRAGHKPIGVVGGGTGMIGDPSGKSKERQLLDQDELQKNLAGIRKQLERFLDFSEGPRQALMVNNFDWLGKLNLIDFLRDIGKYFRIGEMTARESVRQRMESEEGISFTEFCYQLLQAYDFYHLSGQYDCALQVGGSDQWGNITAGTDLIRRLRQKEAYGMTFPLVTTASGTKFGKTEQGTIWLDENRTSPYQFYQYFIQTDDRDVIKYVNFFTYLSRAEINELEEAVKQEPDKREAQRKLAFEATALVHGRDAAMQAEGASKLLFSDRLENLSDQDLLAVFEQAPRYNLARTELETGVSLTDLLQRAGAFPSKAEAKRKINEGGVYLNNQRVDDQNLKLEIKNLASQHFLVLRAGKKKFYLIRVD